LNEIAEGRLILGVSIGNTLVRTIGVRPAKVRELEDYVGTVRGLLDNQKVQFEGGVEGKITWLEGPTGIPIYVAASGPRLTRAAGRMADGVLLHYGALPHRIREGIDLVRAGTEDAERSLSQVDLNAWVITSVSSDGDLAREHVRGRVAVMLDMIDLGRFSQEEREAIGRIREGSDFSQVASSDSGPGLPELDGFIDMFTLAGTPQEVGAKVQTLATISELSQIVITLPASGGRFPSIESIMRDFAKGVMGA
jgi:5,10-methylenetetrahydromethanopterin reductase